MNILYDHHIMFLFKQQLKINNCTAQNIFLLTKFYKLQNLCIYVLEKLSDVGVCHESTIYLKICIIFARSFE